MKKIDLTHSIILMRHDGIIELHTNKDHLYTVDDVKENIVAIGTLTGNQKVPILINSGSFSSLTPEARDFMASEGALMYSKADAFLLSSLPQKMLINFYIKFNKPVVPTKVFTKEEEAVKWLNGFL